VLLELHRAGREASYRAFQPFVLKSIQALIPFDSAWWGNAAAEPVEIHRLHLHNCPASILDDYVPYMEQDFFRAALMARPCVTINLADLTTRARFVRSALYREVGKRYRIEWSLGTLVEEPVSSLHEFLTLWRHDPRRPFTEAERRTKELLMPHVVEAHRHARLRAVLDGGSARPDDWAVSDTRGYLREASAGFIHALRRHWPLWQGSRLPERLLDCVRDARPYVAGELRLHVAEKGEFRFLESLAPCALDRLAPRERQIAERYARGETHGAIAAALGLAPATVRNHITRCYRKLAVNNKAELILRIAQPANGGNSS
jgi:DNA-binding CsgD family transcriptional regulator